MMRKLRIPWKLQSGETGQSAIFITLLLMFAFIALAALAIDGGILYLARRSLQNRSDAACLAAAVETFQSPGDTTAAFNVAVNYLTLNGASAAWYSPTQGSGVNLTKGIEISGEEVRVALQQQVVTFFTRLIGSPPTLVGSRSHCNAQAGGLLPIAIKRYGEDPDLTSNLGGGCVDGGTGACTNPLGPDGMMDDVDCTNNNPPPGYSCDPLYGLDVGSDGQGENPAPWHNVVDYAQSAGSDVLPAWPQNPGANPGAPADPQCLYLPPFAPAACSEQDVVNLGGPPGRGMYIVGDGALPNVAQGSDFRFFVTLDVRCITCGANRWYNTQYGVNPTTALNTLKNMSMSWVCRGYLGAIPLPGEQIGVLSGADAAQAAGEMADCWEPGDVVGVIVYDGKVYRDPNFAIDVNDPDTLSVTENWVGDTNGNLQRDPDEVSVIGPGNSCAGANSGILFSNCAKYTVTLTPDAHFNSIGVELTVYTGDPWYWPDVLHPDSNGDGVADDVALVASWAPPSDRDGDGNVDDYVETVTGVPVSAATPITRTFYVWQRGSILTPGLHRPMTRTIFIDAYDPSTQRHHLTTARITVGTPGTNDFAVSLGDDPFVTVKKPNAGQQAMTWTLDYQNVGADPPSSTPILQWCSDRTGESCGLSQPTWAQVQWKKQGQDFVLTIRINSNAVVGRYFFKILSPGGSPDTPQGKFVMGGFDVVTESAGGTAATMNSFVVVLGYAQIEILAMDPNSVVGRIIHASADVDDLPQSVVPRLIPWE